MGGGGRKKEGESASGEEEWVRASFRVRVQKAGCWRAYKGARAEDRVRVEEMQWREGR